VKILVTGAGGFAGQHLLRELLSDGDHEISGGVVGGVPPAPGVITSAEIGGVRWLPLDVTSSDSARSVVRESAPDLVYHLAGQSSVSGSFDDPVGTWEVNATGTLRMLLALVEASADGNRLPRVLVISSAEVYGAVPEHRQPISETEAVRPITPYGASKAAAEMVALQMAAAGDLEVVVARSFNHAGPGQDMRFALPSMARQLVEMRNSEGARELRVGNLGPRRDFLDVRDVVRAYRLLLEQGENVGIYNVCSGEARPMAAIVDDLVEISGSGATVVVDVERFREVEIPLLVGDPGRLLDLGWQPEIPMDQTLRDLLDSVAGG
jgi:GDP-4-dehydro-6-deoxy-D-mannose reductase